MFTFKQNTRKNGILKKKTIIAIIATLGVLATFLIGIAVFTNAAYITDTGSTQFVFASSDDPMQILADNGYILGDDDQVVVNRILSNTINIRVLRAVPVYIKDVHGDTTAYKTTASTIGSFLESKGITLGEYDVYDFDLSDSIQADMTIEIEFAPKVTLIADGITREVTIPAGYNSISMFNLIGFNLGENDIVVPDAYHHIYTNETVKVTRVTFQDTKSTEEIPYGTTTVTSTSYVAGSSQVTTAGVNGSKEVTRRTTFHDGVAVSETVIAETVITPSVDEVITIGTASGRATVAQSAAALASVASPTSFYPGQVVSPAPANVPLDANGIPVNYSKIMTGKTSAYTSPVGGVVSCGQVAKIGLVAVNPNIIPYGTRMYIVANDGTVYGYAIAADTGGALMSGKVLIDLYMGPNNEAVCYQWGIRYATIYIL